MKRLLELWVVIIAILNAVETVAGAGVIIIVFGEIVHLWDLL